MNTYYFEMTDTFGGETNYCWLHRFTIKSKSLHGALCKLSKETGFNFRNRDGKYTEFPIYHAIKACIAAYEYPSYESPSQDWIDKSVKL